MDTSLKTFNLLALVVSIALIYPPYDASKGQQTNLARTGTPVLLTVTVAGKDGEFVRDLNRSHFEIAVDKTPAKIVSFKQEDVPMNIGILFDASSSMWLGTSKESRKRMVILQDALRSFFKHSNPANQYFLLAFNTRPQLLVDWTSDPELLAAKLGDVSPKGGTALFDACYLALDKAQNGPHKKRALILLSDGMDNMSQYTFKQLREVLRDIDILVYAIYVDQTVTGLAGSTLGLAGRDILSDLSSDSGGELLFQSRERPLVAVLERIATELRSQYTIGIATNESTKEIKWRKLTVKVNAPATAPKSQKVSVRTRDGFYVR